MPEIYLYPETGGGVDAGRVVDLFDWSPVYEPPTPTKAQITPAGVVTAKSVVIVEGYDSPSGWVVLDLRSGAWIWDGTNFGTGYAGSIRTVAGSTERFEIRRATDWPEGEILIDLFPRAA